jgi:predicted transglutaminase-like cysteine proteinase
LVAAFGRSLLALALVILAGPPALAAPMPLGAGAEPPPGLVEFCRRQPQDCGDDAAAVSRRIADLDAGGTWRRRFAAAHANAEPAAEPPALAMTPELWAQVRRVNDEVNRAIRRRSDLAAYGVADRWATPLSDGGRPYGDCEDFVLEKRRALLAAGLPRGAVDIALVVTRRGEAHAVLLLNTTQGEYALDNLTPWIVPWDEAPYQWRWREVGGDPLRWAAIASRDKAVVQVASRE